MTSKMLRHSTMCLLNIILPSLSYLFKSPDPSNTDFQVCLDSYNEEKQRIIDQDLKDSVSVT